MEIKKATKKDFDNYSRLRKLCNKEYSKITKEKIKVSNKQMKGEFRKFVSSPKQIILFITDNKKDIGYLSGTFFKGLYKKTGYIDDIFIFEKFRKKGYAILLISEFCSLLNKKGFDNCELGVYPNNKKAISLYKKLDFKITHYDMEKNLK